MEKYRSLQTFLVEKFLKIILLVSVAEYGIIVILNHPLVPIVMYYFFKGADTELMGIVSLIIILFVLMGNILGEFVKLLVPPQLTTLSDIGSGALMRSLGMDDKSVVSALGTKEEILLMLILLGMMIPAQVSALGFVQMMNKIHLTNSFIPLILPAVAAPVVFFYMKQYMESVLPLEIVEAARVDGSNEFRTFNTIILPIMKPALAVQAIFSFVSSWNNYFIPALLIDKAEMKTVPIMIAQLRSADYSKFDMGKVYMFILLSILPVMLVYVILSKSIIKGVTSGSVKG